MGINNQLDDILRVDSTGKYRVTYWHHIIFWVLYFAFNTLRWQSIHGDFMYSLKTNLIGFPIHMTLCYLNVYVLMPRFIYTRKYLSYTLLILGALFVMLLVKFNLTYYLVGPNVMPEAEEEVTSITLNYAIVTMIGEVYVISFFTAIKITVDWLREHSKLHDLEKRQLTTELRFLRSQVSPHFFFNTLNNIYSLTLSKSKKAPEVVLKLSELMRYLLYATAQSKQDLKSEIDCIQNYIDLERIRFDDSLEVQMNISGQLEDKKIAPMLLIPLIENCFKHGANKSIDHISILIGVEVKDDFLFFDVSNTVPKTRKSKKAPSEGGIGLSNVKKRLELGYDADDYDLSINEREDKFYVNLKLRV